MKRVLSRPFMGVVAILLMGAGPESVPDPVLADATMNGASVEEIRSLLRAGSDVNVAQGDGMTPLHWAAAHGDPVLAGLFLEAGARTGAVTRLGRYTPLHLAAQGGEGEVVRLLLEGGAEPNAATSSGGATALHLAARSGNREAVVHLLQHGAQVDARDLARDQTPLMYAAALDRVEVMGLLVEAGADPSLSSRVLDVQEAEREDRRAAAVRDSILKLFRGEPEEDGEVRRPAPVEVQTAARAARRFLTMPREARAGDSNPAEATAAPAPPQAAEEAIPAGTNDEPEYNGGWTARIGTYGGLTPLLYAVREGHERAALLLLEAGADINQQGAGDGTSPLLMATINGHFDLARVLIDRGADPNITNASGDSPLYATVETRWAPRVIHPAQHAWMTQETTYLEMMEVLLQAGADPDARLSRHIWYSQFNRSDLGVDMRGATPFWRSAHAVDLDAMRLLLRYGADPTIPTLAPPGSDRIVPRDEEDPSGLPPVKPGDPGTSPLHAAAGVGHGQAAAGNVHRFVPGGFLPAVRFLVEELGFDVNLRDHGGYSAVHHAAARGDNEMILYLVEKGADVMVVSRRGETTVDMANGPFITVRPIPETIALLESLGAINNHRCILC